MADLPTFNVEIKGATEAMFDDVVDVVESHVEETAFEASTATHEELRIDYPKRLEADGYRWRGRIEVAYVSGDHPQKGNTGEGIVVHATTSAT